MRSVDFRILAYAHSETAVIGVDFLIVLKPTDITGRCLRAYLIDDWRSAISCKDPVTTEYLEAVVYDVRQNLVRDCADVDDFFAAIEMLNVGPLRTSASGTCSFEDVDALAPYLPDESFEISSCSSEVFKLLANSILGGDRQPQAARI